MTAYVFHPAADSPDAEADVLDVHGLAVDEAIGEVGAFLDRAFVAGVRRVRIVHGKGTGRLRRAVWQALARAEYVEGFRYAEPHEGSYGATVVDLAPRS